ncbi:hypothetical protein [Salinarimonas ramus]|uniref:Uncharacterized protein n=1 Tax=Salinarimonas ramus TaxID=690164 RepID=A0A917Q4M2_9HYPH|nr:hypothetical protein [Salinarimonas ramus]GGK22484.1 hypothetical protein GCM10011322_06430 [Salinarimonas ramus]
MPDDPIGITRENEPVEPRRAVPATDVVRPVLDLSPDSLVARRRAGAAVISARDLVGPRPRPPIRLAPVVPAVTGGYEFAPDDEPPVWAQRLREAAADERVRIVILTAILIVLSVHVLGDQVLPPPERDVIEAPVPLPEKGHAIAALDR